ncbi:MAG TPA: phosphatase PAP2 family protein [Pseudolabrys sp.]|nr:phosphatase PAP2 family protein [Pseudolabrys sp.]
MDKTAAVSTSQRHARLIWWLIASMAAATTVSFLFAGLSVDLKSNLALLVVFLIIFAVNWLYRTVRPDPHLAALTEISGQILLILLFGILLSYAAVTVNLPYVDAVLYSIDNSLGFDRHKYLDFFAHRPWLAYAIHAAYHCMLPQFALVPVVMFFAMPIERLQTMMIAIVIALLMTTAVSVFTPSLTAFVHVDLPQMSHVPPGLYTPEATMEGLRAGTFRVIRLDNLEGLISFPSFHTTAALIFIWTVCTVPYVRWASVIVNLALISATPIDGAHYFVDVIGGFAVAGIAIFVGVALSRHASRTSAGLMTARAEIGLDRTTIRGR